MASPLGAEQGQSRNRHLPHPEHGYVKLNVVPNFERVRVFDVTV